MILFHGSNCDFNSIDLSMSKDKRDFGKGFYTTELFEQAKDWAVSLFDRYKGHGVFVYEIEFEPINSLLYKKYDGLSEDWLLMVQKNRTLGGIQHTYDVIQGPVANDKTTRTIALFTAGIIDVDETLKRLQYSKINDQISFHSSLALSHLKITGKHQYE
jgi:hypothetical protein